MGKVYSDLGLTADGFATGLNQREEKPFGDINENWLHGWMFETAEENKAEVDAIVDSGATVMGRNMFGPVRGEWGDSDWTGWWGDEPPYHCPVFVLTHHAREPVALSGGTTFHFVTDGFDAAYAQASETAGDRGVDIAGGASAVRQALIAGVVDELTLDITPVLLGGGERMFDGVDSFGFEPVEVLHSPLATHVRYRRVTAG
jgi:dihydrofolate reductase